MGSLDPVWPLVNWKSSSKVVDPDMEPGVGEWKCVQFGIVGQVLKEFCGLWLLSGLSRISLASRVRLLALWALAWSSWER